MLTKPLFLLFEIKTDIFIRTYIVQIKVSVHIIDAGTFLLFCTLLRVIYFMIQIPFRSEPSLSITFLSFRDFIIAEIVFRLFPNSIYIAVVVILGLFFINLITDISLSVNFSVTLRVTELL